MRLTAEQISENWGRLQSIIDETFVGERLEKIKELHDHFEARMMLAPASGTGWFHNAFPGGYVSHVLNVMQWAKSYYELFKSQGMFVDDINEIYDKHIKKLPHHNNKLAGKIVNEHTIDYLLTDAMKAEFKSMFKTYLIHAQKPYWDCKLTSAWVNEMKINEYNPFHYHTSQNTELGLSSVLMLKRPDTYGKEISRPEDPSNGWLELTGGNQDPLGVSNW